MDSERWEVHRRWYEGKRAYVEISCKICSEHVDRCREDALLPSGKGKVCACTRVERGKPLKEGESFGKLKVVRRVESKGSGARYEVVCECGNKKVLGASQLRQGGTKSCGCLYKEIYGRDLVKHGMAGTAEHKAWMSMMRRVNHPFESTREWYYDKGIKVSDEWNESFENFYRDMGPCPSGYTLDRIDPEGDYCKENCRWASIAMQSINKGMHSNNTSGYKGVSQTKSGRWVAYIYIDRKRFHLGTYETKEAANEARKKGEEKYWSHIKE